MLIHADLLEDVARGLAKDRNVKSVVLFGSRAREQGLVAAADGWSDIDLHVIVANVARFVSASHLAALVNSPLRLQVKRSASGGVNKVTMLYDHAEMDLVVIPQWQMRWARLGLRLGWHQRITLLRIALNEMSTIMRGGYRFLKGENEWGAFYARVVTQLPGQRLGETEVRAMADGFLCDYLWVRQKLARGEFIAAQRGLHHLLAETNYRLTHELRLRKNLDSYREARRLEKLLQPEELSALQISARLAAEELQQSAAQALNTMQGLVGELLPEWRPPKEYAVMVQQATQH